MKNLWTQFRGMLPGNSLDVGTVTAHNSDGTSLITLPSGKKITARGTTVAVGSKAFVRAGLVEGEAPDLESVEIEV